MLQIWTFLHSFGDLLGLPTATLDALLAAGAGNNISHAAFVASDLTVCIVSLQRISLLLLNSLPSFLLRPAITAPSCLSMAVLLDHCLHGSAKTLRKYLKSIGHEITDTMISELDLSTVSAVMHGEQSRLLGEIHIALLKLLQADMEEAYATGAIQVASHTDPKCSVNSICFSCRISWTWCLTILHGLLLH